MEIALTEIIQHWQKQGLDLNPGIPPEELRPRFIEQGVSLPREIEALYSACGGMSNGELDDNLFALWSVEDVLKEAKKYTDGYVPFADGFLSSYTYLYREAENGKAQVFVTIYSCGQRSEKIADSLSEAFGYLQTDPMKFWLP